MLTIERSLNVYAAGIPQIINLSQYDNDFQLVFSLYTSEGTFTVPSGTTAEIMGTKVDGNGYSADATISGNTVTVTGNNQMTACAGRNVFEIVLTNSGKRLATINFILQVERAALDADTIQSETVLKELNAIIESAATSTQAAQDAEDAADRAEEAARTLTIDPTLTQSGQAADAKVTGDEISDLKEDISHKTGLSDEAKVALLACFAHVAWINDRGQEYYDALESALYSEEYPRIKATFDSGSHKIYNVFSANDVKPYIIVKYYETKESEGVTIPQNSFTVSGTLTSGDSVLRVEYQEYSTTLAITDVIDFYNVHHWNSGEDTDVSVVLDRGTYNTTDQTTQLQTTTVEASYNATRKSMWMKYGENEAYYSDFTLSDYYAIPIPEDATGVSITITPSTYRFNCMFRHINETNPHLLTLVTESGWQTGSYTRNDIPYVESRGTSQMICLNTQGVSGSFSAGDPVFDITFTTE